MAISFAETSTVLHFEIDYQFIKCGGVVISLPPKYKLSAQASVAESFSILYRLIWSVLR